MSEKQWKRLDAVRRIKQAALTVAQAAQLLGLSERQLRRLRRAVERLGAKGVVHGNTGRSPAHRLTKRIRAVVVKLMRGKYAGFNDQHFTEKLVEVEKVKRTRGTKRENS